ncbi:hypothetical protein L596_030612 [Steinernema carpocapsae]|uniref:Vesicle transport v-SNARE N-terminal domain-containing protein n=1 Tax=Steinernema carpocapsae TaxID=34508 RepID=A0A4U5LPV9_STECR|nr:hypothetical protein L596_030612 [Steinernema carpocapsae]
MIATGKRDPKLDLLEFKRCDQEVTKVDVDIKKKVSALAGLCTNMTECQLNTYTREIKAEMDKQRDKILVLERIISRMSTRSEDGKALRAELKSHQEELSTNEEQLRISKLRAMNVITDIARKTLFETNTEEAELRQRTKNREQMVEKTTKTTESLSSLVSRMGEQLKLSEETTSNLIFSSDKIKETDEQFTSMGQNIKSGGKLLSKSLILYFGVVMYILRKRLYFPFSLF